MGIHEKDLKKIRAMFKAGYTVKEIAKTFGLREGLVQTICHK